MVEVGETKPFNPGSIFPPVIESYQTKSSVPPQVPVNITEFPKQIVLSNIFLGAVTAFIETFTATNELKHKPLSQRTL